MRSLLFCSSLYDQKEKWKKKEGKDSFRKIGNCYKSPMVHFEIYLRQFISVVSFFVFIYLFILPFGVIFGCIVQYTIPFVQFMFFFFYASYESDKKKGLSGL